MANYLEVSLAKLKEFEGCVPWMYQDTAGLITVGVGLMLRDTHAATDLPFLTPAGPATRAQIVAEFHRIQALPAGRTASFYKRADSLQLSQATIDEKLALVLEGFETDLRAHISNYAVLPDPAKLALLDMAYNLGPAGLLNGFPHLLHEVESGDWSAAAASCTRRGPGTARNEWTREQFLASVATTIKAESEHWLVRFWWQIRHMLSGHGQHRV